ncbi:hypothetical protein EI94DRAFT_1697544 [Lactarius quietus]|nr:hypothetical protein EI94DRAFT_1697544 [Lactarius quietus]
MTKKRCRLPSTLLLFTYFLLLLLVFGPPYLPLATSLVLHPRYLQTSAPHVLRALRFYLPAIAYNGVLEAFLASVCTPADLRAQSRMMAPASAALVATAFSGARIFGAGDVALVWANSVSMAVRALYARRFAHRFCAARATPHRKREIVRALDPGALCPPLAVLAAFAVAAACMHWSATMHADVRLLLWAQCGHVALGGVCLVAWCVSSPPPVSLAPRVRDRLLTTMADVLQLHLGMEPVREDDRSLEEEPKVTAVWVCAKARGWRRRVEGTECAEPCGALWAAEPHDLTAWHH